jgi:uncharacterized protein YjbJ (UPF0337 family)
MRRFRGKATEEEVKGVGQKVKGVAQEIAGVATGDASMRARGEVNQVAGPCPEPRGEAARKIGNAVSREKNRSRR